MCGCGEPLDALMREFIEATVFWGILEPDKYVCTVQCVVLCNAFNCTSLQWQDAEMAYKNTLALCNDCQYQVHVAAKVTANAVRSVEF